uniref:Uncharacterized protein n=1 Tax=Arcella intermedia TaxID=1963864 RepID=A0A6B2LGU4_9EUKA
MLAHYGFPVSQSFPLRVKAGDIVLFSHNRVHGVIIKVATSSRWNHIGVVMPGHLKPNNLRVLHATTAGVTIHSLAGTLNAWAKNKRVCMAFRRVLDAPTEDLKEIESILTNFYMSIEGRPYGNLGVMMKAVLHTNQESDLSTLFCSELVAACFKELGLLAKDTVSSNYVPGDFAKANFKLLKGSLSPVIKVHRPSDRR